MQDQNEKWRAIQLKVRGESCESLNSSSKRILLGTAGIAGIGVGTFLFVLAAVDWIYGPAGFVFFLSSGAALTTGSLEDFLLIVLGISLCGLGAFSLRMSLSKKKQEEERVEKPSAPPQMMPVTVGYSAVAVLVASVRFLGYYDLALFILAVTAFSTFIYLYAMSRPKEEKKRQEGKTE